MNRTDIQICEKLGLKHGFIGAKTAFILGKRYTPQEQDRTIQLCQQGELEAVVVMLKSGKNGCNLQGMNWMISLGYIPACTEEVQAKGILSY